MTYFTSNNCDDIISGMPTYAHKKFWSLKTKTKQKNKTSKLKLLRQWWIQCNCLNTQMIYKIFPDHQQVNGNPVYHCITLLTENSIFLNNVTIHSCLLKVLMQVVHYKFWQCCDCRLTFYIMLHLLYLNLCTEHTSFGLCTFGQNFSKPSTTCNSKMTKLNTAAIIQVNWLHP